MGIAWWLHVEEVRTIEYWIMGVTLAIIVPLIVIDIVKKGFFPKQERR